MRRERRKEDFQCKGGANARICHVYVVVEGLNGAPLGRRAFLRAGRRGCPRKMKQFLFGDDTDLVADSAEILYRLVFEF